MAAINQMNQLLLKVKQQQFQIENVQYQHGIHIIRILQCLNDLKQQLDWNQFFPYIKTPQFQYDQRKIQCEHLLKILHQNLHNIFAQTEDMVK